jgi:hypothetical protein
MQTELCELFKKNLSDKCPQVGHSYSPEYYNLLNENKNIYKNILEIGIGYKELMIPYCGSDYNIGASLKAWSEFFPNANIFGLDIRKDVLFNDKNICCFYTDQSNESELEKTISEIKKYTESQNLTFDLILDDGSHIYDHMVLSFKVLSKYVRINGLYIIEDIQNQYLQSFIDLKIDGFETVKIHKGSKSIDDNFVAYKRIF